MKEDFEIALEDYSNEQVSAGVVILFAKIYIKELEKHIEELEEGREVHEL